MVHVGCHEFDEMWYYKQKGINDFLIFEANPHLFERIKEIERENDGVKAFNYAVCDYVGTTKFHITNNEVSSSILKLKDHEIYYPDVICTKTTEVPCTTIDNVFQSNGLDPKKYNSLVMDVQGAELLCLHGATEYLKSCDLIYTEVNYAEMYEDCGQIEELEKELSKHGFVRKFVIDTLSFQHKWGDALYTKDR
jgi:FkbM family methyltransferase